MKKSIAFLLFCGCIAAGGQAFGQSTKATPLAPGSTATGNSVVYSLPQTVLIVEFTLEQEVIKRGPYARFAQQYLGAVAPLSDKELYTIVSAWLGYATESDPSAVYALDAPDKTDFDLYYQTPQGAVAFDGLSKTRQMPANFGFQVPAAPKNNFDGLQVDKTGMGSPSLEEAAAEAARALFTLRKRRFDLVTGEAGEYVYGEGLRAALEEMKRLEDEYTALFMGNRTVNRITRKVTVIPEAGKNRVIVCRFAEDGGLLPENDLSGQPIVLELTPENKAAGSVANRPAKDSRGTVFLRVADMTRCRLMNDKTVLFDERIPVYQFGKTIETPVTSSK